MLRVSDGRTLLRALIHYVCIDLDSGKPRRMPPEFVSSYQPIDAVRSVLGGDLASFAPGVEPGS